MREDRGMQIGMVGLGKMGGNMTVRLLRGGHDAVSYTHLTLPTIYSV